MSQMRLTPAIALERTGAEVFGTAQAAAEVREGLAHTALRPHLLPLDEVSDNAAFRALEDLGLLLQPSLLFPLELDRQACH